MKKQLIGIFSLAALASSSLVAQVELVNDTFDASSQLTKNTGSDWFLHVDDADDKWHAADSSDWTHGVGGGFMYNGATDGSRVSDGAIATMLSLSGLGLGAENQLTVDFNYSSWGGNGDNAVQVHLWLVTDNGLVAGDQIAYIGANNGRMDERSAFTTPAENFDAYHVADGTAVGFNDVKVSFAATDTVDQTPGNVANFQQTFDISGYATGGTLVDYDYFVLGISRNVDAGDNSFALHDIKVTAIPEPSSYALLGGLLALSSVMLRRRQA